MERHREGKKVAAEVAGRVVFLKVNDGTNYLTSAFMKYIELRAEKMESYHVL